MFLALAVQGVAVVTGSVLVGWFWQISGLAVLYGGLVALASSASLVWRWQRGVTDFHSDGRRHMQDFRRSLRERFFVVVLLLALGFAAGLLHPGFAPLPVLMGFIMGQLSWVAAAAGLKTK